MRIWRLLALVGLLVAAPLRAETVDITLDQARVIARQAYGAGEFGIANALARRLVQANPHDAQALLILAATEPALGNAQAGRRAGRAAWAAATDPQLRYEIARHSALAAFQAGRPTAAQFWLRRAVGVAPTAQDRTKTINDYREIQRRSPLRFALDLAVAPTSNLNGGGQGGVLEIDGQILNGFYNRSLPPLSGVRTDVQARLSYKIRETARAQTTLGFSLESSVNVLSDRAQAHALDVSGQEFNQTTAEASVVQDFFWPASQQPISLTLAAGQNWSGGAVLGPHLRLDASTPLVASDRGEVRVAASVQRQWQSVGPVDSRSLAVMARRGDGAGGVFAAALYLRDVQGAAVNQSYQDAQAVLSYALGKPVAAVDLAARLSVGMRDYDQYQLGFAQVTNGRQDRRFGASFEMTFNQISVMGYAPTLRLSGTQTQSNVNWFDSRELGVSVGFASQF
jgi:hypothetical protein